MDPAPRTPTDASEPSASHAEAVADARARARKSRPSELYRPDPAELPEFPRSLFDPYRAPDHPPVGDHIPDSFLYTPSHSAGVWLDIFERDVRFKISSHRGGLKGRVVVWLKRLLGRLWRAPLADLFQRQRVFNVVLLRSMQLQMDEMRRLIMRIRGPYEQLREQAIPDVVSRTDAIFGILDRRVEVLDAELRRLRDDVRDLALQPRPAGADAASGVEVGGAEQRKAPAKRSTPALDDGVYYDFEALHRGTEEEIRDRQSGYVPLFVGGERIVDLGCGRGEMLRLLRDHGIRAYGVDVNSAMVYACRKSGLEVVHGDAADHLRELEDDSLDGAFSAQTFEHWEPGKIVDVVRLMHRKLRPGAPFVMETQNPLSLVVGASSFWRDLTHVRPIHPDAFQFLVKAVGFRSIELRQLSPFSDAQRLARVRSLEGLPDSTARVVDDVNRILDSVDELLHGFADYAVVAWK